MRSWMFSKEWIQNQLMLLKGVLLPFLPFWQFFIFNGHGKINVNYIIYWFHQLFWEMRYDNASTLDLFQIWNSMAWIISVKNLGGVSPTEQRIGIAVSIFLSTREPYLDCGPENIEARRFWVSKRRDFDWNDDRWNRNILMDGPGCES